LPVVLLFLLQVSQPADGFIIRLITETLQNNVAGEPILHERTSWDFDPEAAKKARSLYYEVSKYSLFGWMIRKPIFILEKWIPFGQVHRAIGSGSGWAARGSSGGSRTSGCGPPERGTQCELSAFVGLAINNYDLNLTLVSFAMLNPR